MSELSRLKLDALRKMFKSKSDTKKHILATEARRRMDPPPEGDSLFQIIIGDAQRLDPYVSFVVYGESSLCRGNVGSPLYWDDVAAGKYKFDGILILWNQDRVSWDGFVLFVFDKDCSRTVRTPGTTSLYVEVICSKPSFGKSLLEMIVYMARIHPQHRFGSVSLSALPYVVPYYAQFGFTVQQRGKVPSPRPPEGRRFSSFHDAIKDPQYAKFIKAIEKHKLGGYDGIYMHMLL